MNERGSSSLVLARQHNHVMLQTHTLLNVGILPVVRALAKHHVSPEGENITERKRSQEIEFHGSVKESTGCRPATDTVARSHQPRAAPGRRFPSLAYTVMHVEETFYVR